MNNRIGWIDTAKGILILLVLMGHIPSIMREHFAEGSLGMVYYYDIPHSYVRSFFMQAFFILTGFTSSFNKPMKEFFTSLIKSVVLPYITLSLFTKILGVIFLGESLWYHQWGETKFFLFENFWFIHALIISKLIYYFLYNCKINKYLMGGGFLLLIILSVILNSYYNNNYMSPHYHNYFHYRNGLAMVFFVWIGTLFKGKDISNKATVVGSIMFIFLSIISFINLYIARKIEFFDGLKILSFLPNPVHYTHNPDFFDIIQIPEYIVYALTGTCLIVLISKIISNSTKFCVKFLDYLGKNSLVVYCTHFVFMGIFINIFYTFITPTGYSTSAIYFFLVLCATIISCVASIELFKLKPFKYLLGKF